MASDQTDRIPANVKRSRGWMFTWNNYTSADEEQVRLVASTESSYCVYGKEIAPSTGTPHLQGYIEFPNARAQTAVALLLRSQTGACWVSARKGTPVQAADYCKKTDTAYWEYGKPPRGAGARTDLDLVRQSIRDQVPIRDIASSLGYQALKHAEVLIKYAEKPRTWKPVSIWIYGPSGYGKSYLAKDVSPPEKRWRHKCISPLKFWTAYDAHEYVVLDDLRSDTVPFMTLLGIMDDDECVVEVKHGHRQMLARQVVVTTTRSPVDTYRSSGEDMYQLLRRLDYIVKFTAPGEYVYEKVPGDGQYEYKFPSVASSICTEEDPLPEDSNAPSC